MPDHTLQRGNQQTVSPAAQPAPAAPTSIQRLPNTPVTAKTGTQNNAQAPVAGTMDRAAFEQTMKKEFGVKQVITGTQATQEGIVGQPIPGWKSWEPDATADEYQQIVDAFRDFRAVFSTTPVVTDITFYECGYDVVNGVVTRDSKTGASFGVTDLTIFKTATTMPVPLPLDRSNAQGKYGSPPPMSLGMSYKGSPKAAPLIVPGTHPENFRRAVVHELGHGLESAAMNLPNPASAADPAMGDDYRKAVGWTSYMPAANNQPAVPPQLYDISVKAVQTAIGNGTTPPSQYQILSTNWNDPSWGEQPVSEYSLDNPGEDFAESVMAYVYNPQVLLQRSPARYNFINTRRLKWLPGMRLIRPYPDYNDAPDRKDLRHYA